MKHMKYLQSTIVALCLFTLAVPMMAAEKQAPIQVEADHMLSDQNNSSVFFSGKVEAKQDEILINSDEMTVYYKSGEQAKGDDKGMDVQRILAKGNVEITETEWVATGDEAEYFTDLRKVIITGNTKVWQDNNLVTGDKFIMYLDEGKSIVERSKKEGERVKVFFYPDSEKKDESTQ